MHEDPRHGEFRQHDGVAGTDHGIGIFHEHVERARLALGVLPVIGDAGEDLSRPRQRRFQAHFFDRSGRPLPRQALQGRAQGIEIIDDALHGQLRRVALLHRGGYVDDAAVGEQARQYFAICRRLEQHQFHEFLPIFCRGYQHIARSGHQTPTFGAYQTCPRSPAYGGRRRLRRNCLAQFGAISL